VRRAIEDALSLARALADQEYLMHLNVGLGIVLTRSHSVKAAFNTR
jgi:hypothetical protein